MESTDPLENELGRYQNQWVAIAEAERKIVGSGDTARQAKAEAAAKGYAEAALFRVPPAGKSYVL